MKRIALLCSCLIVIAATSHATQIVYRSAQELGRDASLVVDGRVSAVRSYWNAAHTAILTETTVEVANTYKGGKTPVVRVVQPGGTVGHVRTTVAGALAWSVGEDVVLFLEPGIDDAYQVAGFSQGKFTVERDEDTGKAFVRAPDTGGAQVLGAPAAGRREARVDRISVETFINQALGRK